MTDDREITRRELQRMVSLRQIVEEYVPLKREGREWKARCPFHEERTPSFGVVEEDGYFKCFGCGEGGDAITFLMKIAGLDFPKAHEIVEARAGLRPLPKGVKPLPVVKPRPKQTAENEERRRAKRVGWALEIWNETVPANGTAAEQYLIGRGIDIHALGGMPELLRFHPRLYCKETGLSYPAMVAGIQNAEGEITGVHRTWLRRAPVAEHPSAHAAYAVLTGQPFDKVESVVVKARLNKAKKILGLFHEVGGTWLAPASHTLYIAEGIETALSVMLAMEGPAWVGLTLGNMGALKLPPVVREVVLCADNDSKVKDREAHEKSLQAAAAAYRKQEVEVRIARPPQGMDFNDVLMARYRVAEAVNAG